MRLFFHNPHDKTSKEMYEIYKELPDVEIIDFFQQKELIPKGSIISQLPYLIDKYIELLTQPPYYTGIVNLQFQCKNYLGENILEEPILQVTIEGETQEIIPTNGLFEIEIECPVMELNIFIRDCNGQGYLPVDFNLNVEEEVI